MHVGVEWEFRVQFSTGRVPVSSSVLPSGLPGATSVSLGLCRVIDPLVVCPPANTPSAFTLLCYSNAFLQPLSIFPEVG